MNILQTIVHIIFSGLVLFFLIFLYSSIIEKRNRAIYISIIFVIAIVGVWASVFIFLKDNQLVLSLIIELFLLSVLFFFAPIGKSKSLKISNSSEQVDERNTMFAREEYTAGTEKYNLFYEMYPEHKETDDKLKKLPKILEPGGKFYNPDASKKVKKIFDEIKSLTTKVDGTVDTTKENKSPEEFTAYFKKLILEMGADEIGVAGIDQRYIYSHVGRGPEKWGSPIINNHKYALVFTVEMAYENVEQAPDVPIILESADKYFESANISIEVAKIIRSLGYPARAHISDSNYQAILPPLAYFAGLGELGRMGYLISSKYGPRIRIGAITTDLPLIPDKPISFGVQDFCKKCKKCSDNCPSKAIPDGDKTIVRGVEKWQLNIEQCIYYWRLAGTDCGLCMKVCPYSHPSTFVHNVVRAGTRRSSFARSVSVWADNLFYGKYDRYGQS